MAWSGSAIASWQPGQSNYERAMAVSKLAQKVYQAEINAGHYTAGKRLMFWLQGETEDHYRTADDYYAVFSNMYRNLSLIHIFFVCGGTKTAGYSVWNQDLDKACRCLYSVYAGWRIIKRVSVFTYCYGFAWRTCNYEQGAVL